MTGTGREYPARPLVGVGVVLFRPAPYGPEIVLIRRGRPPAQGAWSIPGGAQRLGETAEAAARRELHEETALSVGTLHLAAHVDSIHHDPAGRVQFHYTILDFCGVWIGGEAKSGGDTTELAWASLDHLDRFDLPGQTHSVIVSSCLILRI